MFGPMLPPLLLVLVSPALAVPRPVKVAAIFDHDSDMRHDLMFVNAIKVGESVVMAHLIAQNRTKCIVDSKL